MIRKIKDRTRARFQLGLSEVGAQDTWQRVVLGFALVSNERSLVENALSDVVGFIEAMGLASVAGDEREILSYGDAPLSGGAFEAAGESESMDPDWVPESWKAMDAGMDGTGMGDSGMGGAPKGSPRGSVRSPVKTPGSTVMGQGTRQQRVANAMRELLTELIAREGKDPRVHAAGMVSVSQVELNRDLSVAWVFVAFVGGTGHGQTEDRALAAVQSAAGFLRGPGGRRLRLQRAPELRFARDPRAEFWQRMRVILREDEQRAAGAEPAAPADAGTPGAGPALATEVAAAPASDAATGEQDRDEQDS